MEGLAKAAGRGVVALVAVARLVVDVSSYVTRVGSLDDLTFVATHLIL